MGKSEKILLPSIRSGDDGAFFCIEEGMGGDVKGRVLISEVVEELYSMEDEVFVELMSLGKCMVTDEKDPMGREMGDGLIEACLGLAHNLLGVASELDVVRRRHDREKSGS